MENPHLFDRRFVEKREYDIKQLWDSHQEILRLLVLGKNNQQVAEELGITPQTVSNVRNSPLAREHLQTLQNGRDAETTQIHKRVQEFAPVALQLLEEIIRGEHEDASIGLRAREANNALGRAGMGPIQKIASLSTTLSRDDIEAIKERARSAAREQGVMVADYEDQSSPQISRFDLGGNGQETSLNESIANDNG